MTMGKLNFCFPSESIGLGIPLGDARGQRTNHDASSVAFNVNTPWFDSGYTSPGNILKRKAVKTIYESPTLDPYHSSMSEKNTLLVRVGTKSYTFVKLIDCPTEGKKGMSDGVRVLKDSAGMLIVEKRLRMNDESSRDRARAEVRALEQIKGAGGSPHINRLEEALFSEGDSHSSLMLEYCDSGSLQDLIETSRGRGELINEAFCWHVLLQLSSALALCHHGICNPLKPNDRPQGWNTICHIDIKPANVFLRSKKATGFENAPWPTVILGDFGCAVTKRDFKSGKVSSTTVPFGTPGWYPPEANQGRNEVRGMGPYGRQTDIWQLGGIVHVMCHKLSLPDMHMVESSSPCGPSYSASINAAVRSSMARKALSRPTAVDVFTRVRQVLRQARAQSQS